MFHGRTACLRCDWCGNRRMIAEACGRNDGIINTPDVRTKPVRNQPNQRIIAAILCNGVYNTAFGYEDDGLNSEDFVYIDPGDHSNAELQNTIEYRIIEATNCGLSPNEVSKLRHIVTKNK